MEFDKFVLIVRGEMVMNVVRGWVLMGMCPLSRFIIYLFSLIRLTSVRSWRCEMMFNQAIVVHILCSWVVLQVRGRLRMSTEWGDWVEYKGASLLTACLWLFGFIWISSIMDYYDLYNMLQKDRYKIPVNFWWIVHCTREFTYRNPLRHYWGQT